ncbi:hypothetical protein PRIPAC_72168, partial [Pristionchus pacificus]
DFYARLHGHLCAATMDILGDPRGVSLSGQDSRLARRNQDLVDTSFASTCQAIRANKEVCPFGCNKLLAPRTIDFHRLNGCRGKQEDAFADLSRKRSFTCGVCCEEFVTREAFFLHLTAEHAVEATIRSEVFPSEYSFQRFRYWLEAQGGAHFRQKSGAKNRPSGKGIFMMCNRSGLVHTTAATGEPDKDKLGSYRMGFTCTAFINGTIYPDGHVAIRYCGDHYGHDARVRMPQSVKNLIMHMQGQGTSNSMIIRYLQDRFVPFGLTSIHAQRAAYVDLEEMRAITPMLRKLPGIPYAKEEEWEQEFLETAGISRDWGPAYPPRPADWLPIKEYAEKMNWPPPHVFKAKVRNAAGEWLIFDDERQQFVLEAMPRLKDDPFLDELDMVREMRDDGVGEEEEADGGEEHEEEEVEVDVEEMRSKGEERARPSTSAHSSPVRKKQRVDERREEERMEEEEEGEMEEEDTVVNGHHHHPHHHHEQQPRASSSASAFLASSIIAELEMLRALVKGEAQFLSEVELEACLKQARSLRRSLEPTPRRERGGGQGEFAVPQLARVSRALPSRGRTRAFRDRKMSGSEPLRSPLFAGGGSSNGGGGAWTPTAPDQHQHPHTTAAPAVCTGHLAPAARKRTAGASIMLIDPSDVDVADEDMMATAGGTRLRYNSRMWT